MNVPAHKIASFELVDSALIQRIARTGKPIIMSTGMAALDEIAEAVKDIQEAGGTQLALLKCTSGYPAAPEEMNLRTIPDLAARFEVPVGLSDHTLGIAVPVAAGDIGRVYCGEALYAVAGRAGRTARFRWNRTSSSRCGCDSHRREGIWSRELRTDKGEAASRMFRRSLFVVKDVKAGEPFTEENVRSIRPGHGMHTRHLSEVLGRKSCAGCQTWHTAQMGACHKSVAVHT